MITVNLNVQFKKTLRKKKNIQGRGPHIKLQSSPSTECPVNLKIFGLSLYGTDDYTYVESQLKHEILICSGNIEHIGFAQLLPKNTFKRCIRQQYATKTNTVFPYFYCNFRTSRFVEHLCQVSLQIYGRFFFPRNHPEPTNHVAY